MVGLRVAKLSIVTAAPSPSSTSLILRGAGVPFARPTDRVSDTAGDKLVAAAELPTIRICTGSMPRALGPVQLMELLVEAKSSWSLPSAPLTQKSSALVAPPLAGAPV